MCGRDEACSDARFAERRLAEFREAERVAARMEICARLLSPEELERIRSRFELDAFELDSPIDATDRGWLLAHVTALEGDLARLRYELEAERSFSDAYHAQLECIESARWFRWGRRLFGFRPLRPMRPLPDFPRY